MKVNDGSSVFHAIYFILQKRTEAAFRKAIAESREYLSQHPGILDFRIGRRAEELRRGVNDCAFDIGMTIIFRSAEDYRAYLDDPQHEAWYPKTAKVVRQDATRVFDAYLDYKTSEPSLPRRWIEALEAAVEGYVLQPGDARYVESTQIDNGRVRLQPAVIVLAKVEQDVVAALAFARKHRLPFNVKGGGHSAAGYCLNEGGVVVDLRHLDRFEHDEAARTVTIGMGLRWKAVYELLKERSPSGLIPVGGGCPTVGPPGFVQGGGYSFVSRSYGMCVDNLLSARVVTPNGRIKHVGQHSRSAADKDLFWAIRGGGGGNFGVVTEMEMRIHEPRSKLMLVGQITFPMEQGEEVLAYYNDWVEELPDAMAVYGRWGRQPDPIDATKSIATLSLTPVFNGEFEEGMELLRGIFAMGPIASNIRNMTLPDWEFYNGYSTLVGSRSAYMKSLMVQPGHLGAKAAKVIIRHMSQAPSPDSFVVWTHGGGAISRVGETDTSFWHRDVRFIPEVKAIWDADRPDQAARNIEWSNAFFDELATATAATGAYVNYIDPLLHDWATKYYGGNYPRLLEIKQKVDPKNLFGFQQGIGSDFDPKPHTHDFSPLDRTQAPPKGAR
ncbi:MAG: FAD-binding protein [Sandaracinaceae bacterium]|nr:FAD-binding protein [Sandaracinaceae bacterium]